MTVGNGESDVAKKADLDGVPDTITTQLEILSNRDGVDVFAILQKMREGDKEATNKLVHYMRQEPALASSVLEHTSTAMSRWLDSVTTEPFTRFVMEERATRLRRALLGDVSTPLERLLVEQIAVCSLQVQIAEAKYIDVMNGSSTFAKAQFYADMQDRAQRRYLAAIKALAQIRRLQLPAVAQLNVATNQVNLSQSVDRVAPKLPDSDRGVIDEVKTGQQ
jgi:hypothetical protein